MKVKLWPLEALVYPVIELGSLATAAALGVLFCDFRTFPLVANIIQKGTATFSLIR